MQRAVLCLFLILLGRPALAADTGIFVRSSCSTLSAVTNNSWCFQQSDGQVYVWSGSAWAPVNAGGSGPVVVPGYTVATLPAAGTPGRLVRVTDNLRGIWRDDGKHWASLTGVANVVDFGADPTGSADSTPAIAAAVAAASPGGTVEVPCGTFKLASTLSLSRASVAAVTLRGICTPAYVGSSRGSVLSYTGRGGVAVQIGSKDGNPDRVGFTYHVTLRDLVIQNAASGETGLQVVNANQTRLERLHIVGFPVYGISLLGGNVRVQIRDSRVDGVRSGTGIAMGNYEFGNNVVQVEDTQVIQAQDAFAIGTGRAIFIRDSNVEILTRSVVRFAAVTLHNVQVTGVYCEGNPGYFFYHDSVSSSVQGMVLAGNTFMATGSDRDKPQWGNLDRRKYLGVVEYGNYLETGGGVSGAVTPTLFAADPPVFALLAVRNPGKKTEPGQTGVILEGPIGGANTPSILDDIISRNVHDYQPPSGLGAVASVWRLNTSAPHTVTGLAGGSAGRMVTLINVGTAPLTLKHNSGLSRADNRFLLAGEGDFSLLSGNAVICVHDGTGWRLVR